MQESEEKVIVMSGMDEGALEELVRFAYCGKVTLTEDSVLELLVAANRLQMPQVVEQACDFLLQRMDSSNCLVRSPALPQPPCDHDRALIHLHHHHPTPTPTPQAILGIASTYSCASMKARAEAYIHRHFESVYKGEEFLAMPFDQLVALLGSDSISITSEQITFQGAYVWACVRSAPGGLRGDVGLVGLVCVAYHCQLLNHSGGAVGDARPGEPRPAHPAPPQHRPPRGEPARLTTTAMDPNRLIDPQQ